jgi:hypothetical protein
MSGRCIAGLIATVVILPPMTLFVLGLCRAAADD